MEENLRSDLQALRDLVWGMDIASSTCPEYVEHHRDIQQILKAIDAIMEKVN